MASDSSDDKNKYSKRIDDIIEDAEIEAELEAEKKLRMKKSKAALAILACIVLLGGIYFGVTQKIKNSAENQPPLAKMPVLTSPELKPIPFPLEGKETPLPPLGNNELKTEFRQRDFVKGTPSVANSIFVGKAIGSSTSVYACFNPLSKSIRDKACTDGKVYTISDSTRTAVTGAANCGSSLAAWSTGVATTQLVVCLPE